MAAEFEGSVEQVHRAFGDEQYWLERLADSGADDYSLDSMTVNGEGIDVVTTVTSWPIRRSSPARLAVFSSSPPIFGSFTLLALQR